MRFPIAFGIVYFGVGVVDSVMAVLPLWLINGLNVAGGVLPGLGIAATLLVINKKQYIPVFLIGYFMVIIFNVSIVAAAILGICAVVLFTVLSIEEESLLLSKNGDDNDD